MSFTTAEAGVWAWAAAFVVACVVAVVLRQRLKRRLTAREAQIESLRDEVWELKASAAARDRAEAASEAKSRFLATVSHEIRTPLSGIVGLADLLAHSPLAGEQRAYVESIRTCGAALASLIDEILDFSKIEAGRIDLAHEPIALATLVEGVIELLAPRAHGKGLEIAGYVAPDVPPQILGDEARLRQVLMNLAGNAVKFTETGGVGVSVVRDGDSGLAFRVRDTGIGVPRERQAAIFAEFEQGDTSTTRRHGGTGLGLAISQRLVARMGGRIGLESAPGSGSVFAVSLPLEVAAGAESPAGARGGPLRGKSALIVAKSIFEAPYIGALLAQAGAEVAYADEADEARGRLRGADVPDIVLVDCALGQGAVQALAEAARAADVEHSLVLFSPFERRDFGQESVEGFDGWLVKPVRASSLFARLTDAPEGARRGAPAGAVAAQPGLPAGLRILFAEDDEINALILGTFLSRLGVEAMHVSDGAEALCLAEDAIAGRRAAFDAVVMDINMPRLDGREAARLIRKAEAEAGAAPGLLVALTANAFAEDQRACLEAGFDTFLTKPVEIDALRRALAAARPVREPARAGIARRA